MTPLSLFWMVKVDRESHFEDISDSDSEFEPDVSATETVTAVGKLGAEGKNHQQQFQESDEDDITLSHMVNSNTKSTEEKAKNVSVWRNVLLNDPGDITFQDLPVHFVMMTSIHLISILKCLLATASLIC